MVVLSNISSVLGSILIGSQDVCMLPNCYVTSGVGITINSGTVQDNYVKLFLYCDLLLSVFQNFIFLFFYFMYTMCYGLFIYLFIFYYFVS